MTGGKATWAVAAAAWVAAAGILIAADAPAKGSVLNPAGHEASDIVKEVMKKFGIEQGKLEFVDAGTWIYASQNSATVAVETTERAAAVIEYGETDKYGARVASGGLHYIHVFQLKDLKPDTAYHLRVTATGRDGAQVVGKDQAVKTRVIANAVRIPDDVQGPPYVLDKPDTVYLVTKDIVAPRTAFNITASGVTLDLGGHTITYNDEHLGLPTDSFNNMLKDSSFGVRARGVEKNVKILNGTIRQGKGNDEGSYTTIGFNPIYLSGGAGSEIAGVTCVYSGTQLSGIICHWSGSDIQIHHCVIDDLGNKIANRHQQCAAVKLESPGGGKLYNNLVRRARQGALASVGKDSQVYSNELHIDSHSINSFGIGPKDGCDVHHNKIFGCGDNVVAISTTGGCDKVKVHDNYIWLQAHDIADYKQDLNEKDMEASDYSIMSGVRVTWGCKSVDYQHNVILVTAREGGKIRGTFLYADEKAAGVLFRDNLVIALTEDEKSDGWGAIAGVGNTQRGAVIPMEFRNNTVVSNFANFNMQDSYGTSSNYRFIGNTFVKVGDNPGYRTIRRSQGYLSKGHTFVDSVFEGGASYDQTSIAGGENFAVQWTLTLTAPAGAKVSIKDAAGEVAFEGTVPVEGKLSVPLTQYIQDGNKRAAKTPHEVTVTAGGKTATKTVTMEGKQAVEVKL